MLLIVGPSFRRQRAAPRFRLAGGARRICDSAYPNRFGPALQAQKYQEPLSVRSRGSCSLSGGPAVARPVFGESGFIAPCAATRLTLSMRRAMLESGIFRVRIAYERRPLGGAGVG